MAQWSLCVWDVSLLAPEGCSMSLRGAGASDIQDFPRPQPQPPLGTPFTVGADAFLAPSALISEPTAALELRLFPWCGIPMKRPHIGPSPRSRRVGGATWMWTSDRVCFFSPHSLTMDSLVIFSLPTHSSEMAAVVHPVTSLLFQKTSLLPIILSPKGYLAMQDN